MPSIGGWEFFLVAALALIVVGPKDLPRMLRQVGQWVGMARRMAREFQSTVNDMAREAELDDLQRDVRRIADDATSGTTTPSASTAARPAPSIASAASAALVPDATPAAPPDPSGSVAPEQPATVAQPATPDSAPAAGKLNGAGHGSPASDASTPNPASHTARESVG